MVETEHVCALLRPLVSDHRYGAPLPEDPLVAKASFEPHEEGAVRTAYESLTGLPFIEHHPGRGVMLDSSRFGELAEYLHDNCGWPAWELRTKLKHYEGWDEHDWNDDSL